MAWTKYQIILVVILVVTGSFNTLSTKWADKMESEGADGTVRNFTHPFFQAVIMFIGELSCLLAFKILYFYFKKKDNSQDVRDLVRGNRNFSVWIFCLPAVCDILGTSIIYIGLTLTYASSFQMLRGSLIVFVALLSVGFLRRKINYRESVGIVFVIVGLILVGASDFMNHSESYNGNSVITGVTFGLVDVWVLHLAFMVEKLVLHFHFRFYEEKTFNRDIWDLLIILAQIITATQIVLEEHFVSGRDIPPLQAVGWEGCFGFTILGFLLIPLYYIHVGKPISNSPEGRLEDLNDALVQIKNNLMLLIPLFGTAVSIAFFNFAGISVTKEISGTTRTILDSVRTLFVWIMSLALGWQSFSALQIFGFFVFLLGVFIYNDILIPDMTKKVCQLLKFKSQTKREESLINQAPDEI